MPEFREEMGARYGFAGPTIRLGRPFAAADAIETAIQVGIPLALMNRHGLIAGATGTGKTKTLQLIAEQLSAAGVPVFAADMKGDLAGLGAPGETNDRIAERATTLAHEWTATAAPVELLSLTQDAGVPIRASVAGFGPTLLARVLGLNETQESSLALLFRFCDEQGLPLIELEDLRAALAYLAGPGKDQLGDIGGVSKATVGVIQRKVSQLEGEGGDEFFGEPEFDIQDVMRRTEDGRGIVSLLDLTGVAQRPALFSTFLMWLLAELFEQLPEVGDAEKPELVFFFDEAHLLFADASKQFLESVAQTARLIRSKGVGVFFITQLPTDVSDEVLSQLGHRVQHAVRAFTAKDARALKAAVETFPMSEHYDLAEMLQSLGVGEAAVTVLDPRGVPTPVAATRIYAPATRMAPLSPDERAAIVTASPLRADYAERVDRESAEELLAARMEGDRAREQEVRQRPRAEAERGPAERRRKTSRGDDDLAGKVGDFLGSRQGKQIQKRVTRGLFGLLKRSL